MTRAELKNDIIISGYKWNFDIIKDYVDVQNLNVSPKLVVFAHFNALPSEVEFTEDIH